MIRTLVSVVLVASVGIAGCGGQGGGRGGVLNQLATLPDLDADGFADIEPPEGTAFDPADTLAMRITNTITRSQAEAASDVDLPTAVSGSVAVWVDAAVTVTYADGTVQILRGSFPLGPRELAFEVACPQSVEVLMTAVADTPVTAPQAVKTFGPFTSAQANGQRPFECGELLTVETSTDSETGDLVASLVVE